MSDVGKQFALEIQRQILRRVCSLIAESIVFAIVNELNPEEIALCIRSQYPDCYQDWVESSVVDTR